MPSRSESQAGQIEDMQSTVIFRSVAIYYGRRKLPFSNNFSNCMKRLSTNELRDMYLDYYVQHGHRLCASDVLVPKWDKSVLFTPAGMNPFKDHFLGKVHLEFTRATSCQKCLRTGDIDNVGRTAYHHTFFEMLGNFSFGDYFKKEAIHWAWEFLTSPKWLAIDPNRLTVTVYLDDDEAANIWHNEIGLPTDRIFRMDEHDNFWPAGAPSNGPDGVCGPCSEIFYHPPGGRKEVEIWNLVFTQFNRDGDPPNNLLPLPSKNIDTGMGLERTAAQLQGVETNFHIDILRPIVEAAADICSVKYEMDSDNGRRLRRITDHIRACTFAIHENVYPGAAKEEYVVRRLLRRAILDGHQMGMIEPFLHQLVGKVAEMMVKPYPEISETIDRVSQVVRREEENFLGSIEDGLARVNRIFADSVDPATGMVYGRDVADLYQTYGVPPELFEAMAVEKGYAVDWDGYRDAMEQHSASSGKFADSVMGDFGPIDEIKREVKSSAFVGYQTTSATATVLGLIANNQVCELITQTDSDAILILDSTPFYAESGGQVGDSGTIETSTGRFVVTDTQRNGDVVLHFGSVSSGEIRNKQSARTIIDSERRDAIRRAHSATHILHHALQTTLGSHAQQRGSKVAEDWLRFDFSNMQAVTNEELAQIESLSNQKINLAAPISADTLPLSEARQKGAMMLFGEKYPDPVRMVSIGDFSKELCGGTHLSNSKDVVLLEIQSEEGVSAGTRRIEALTGKRAAEFRDQVGEEIRNVCSLLKSSPNDFPNAVNDLNRQVKDLRKQLASGKAPQRNARFESTRVDIKPDYVSQRSALKETARLLNTPMFALAERVTTLLAEMESLRQQIDTASSSASISTSDLAATATNVSGTNLIVQEIQDVNPAVLRQLVDELREQMRSVAIFLATATAEDKVMLVAGVSSDLIPKGIKAGDWIKAVAPMVGGGGGGKPDFAQAGGKEPRNIQAALDEAANYARSRLIK